MHSTCTIIVLCLLSGVQGRLTNAPQNVLMLPGEDAFLNCSTDALYGNGSNPINWRYNGNLIVSSPCRSLNRYSSFIKVLPDAARSCNIRVKEPWKSGISDTSGPYTCRDRNSQVVATVILLGERLRCISYQFSGGSKLSELGGAKGARDSWRGLGPEGSRGRAPVGGLGTKSPRKRSILPKYTLSWKKSGPLSKVQ